MPKKPKIPQMTQGGKKMEIFLNELLKNKKFLDEINEYIKIDDLPFDEVNDEMIEERDNLLIKICVQYGLDFNDFHFLLKHVRSWKPIQAKLVPYLGSNIDTCSISNVDDDFGETGGSFCKPAPYNIEERAHLCAYPLSIDIRPIASKNDILDFIDKNWNNIEKMMDWHRKKSKTDIRKRGEVALYDLVWKFRELSTDEIKEIVRQVFPEITIGYQEINKIISLEKQRRDKNLSLLIK